MYAGRLYIFIFFKLRMLRDHVAREKYVREGIYSEWKSTLTHRSKSVKLLGVEIDNKLNFLPHIETMCKKANKKINALFRIRNFISCDKARLLSSAYILSVFAHCPLIWMFCGIKGNNLINKTHKRALKAVYQNYDLSLLDLLSIDNEVTIHVKNLRFLMYV